MISEYASWAALGLYLIASVCLMCYGLHCYYMLILFLRRQKSSRATVEKIVDAYNKDRKNEDYPFVTFQLPVYNEAEVIGRLVHSAIGVDYPKDRFEIQVVDDSNDETCGIIDEIITVLQGKGFLISASRRNDRIGFKAGALAHAMTAAKGELVAIFDSDFLVPENFLKRTVAQIVESDDLACIQGRWGHLNRHENWLTRAQSVGIDGHFAAEQGARSYNGLCMNFNGTAGLWRASAIEAGGGWQGDTITEDLDLSYRVQLEGFRIQYDFDLECKAEIPNNIIALKSQQKRWAKGSMETAIKLMPRIIKSDRLSFTHKIEAFMHLTHYFVAVLMLVLCALTLPVLLTVPFLAFSWPLMAIWGLIIFSAMAPCVMYTGSGIILGRGLFSLSHFPAMLAMGSGLCINNAMAVIEAFRGHKTEFVRTPKSGSSATISQKGRYHLQAQALPALIETVLGTYCLYTFVIYLEKQKYVFGFFIAAYAFGLLVIGLKSLAQQLGQQRRQTVRNG